MFLVQSMGRSLLVAFVGILGFGFAMTGCGGSGEAEPLKKPQFVQQADSICRTATQTREEELEEAAQQGSGADAQSEPAYFVTEVALPPVQKMTEELQDLGPPRGDTKEVRTIIAAFERGIAQVEADPTDLTAAVSAFAKANRLAEEYGLKDCTI